MKAGIDKWQVSQNCNRSSEAEQSNLSQPAWILHSWACKPGDNLVIMTAHNIGFSPSALLEG